MKSFIAITCSLLTLATASALSQTRRIVLIEEATNASCIPCAANNPKLQAFFSTHFGNVISVRYHAWWPGSDPMYSQNTADNTNRIQYYGITGVPNYLMDAGNYGVPGDPEGMVGFMREKLAVASPVKIKVQPTITPDSVKAAVTIIGLAPVTATNLRLRVAIIERLVVYASPPGANGERDFEDVMRKMLPDGNGTAITGVTVGDTLRFSFSYPVISPWRWQDLTLVAWLQSDANRQVLQSAIGYPTYYVTSPDPAGDFIQLNRSYTKRYSIRNENPTPLNLRIKAIPVQLPTGWTSSLYYNSTARDSITVALAQNDSVSFELRFATGSNPGGIKIRMLATNLDDPYLYANSMEYFGVVKNGNVLFVDADGGENWQPYYYDAFDSARVAYTSIPQGDMAYVASQITPTQYKAIFWNISWSFPAFVLADVAFLKSYLDAGGRLYVAGQDIGWDIFDASGGSRFAEAQNFYHTYLGANYLADNSGGSSMQGVAGDVITDGISFSLLAPYGSGNNYPERIDVYPGTSASVILRYNNSYVGAVRNSTSTFKTVYLGIGLEQMSSADARRLIVRRTLDWFGALTDVNEKNQTPPATFALDQNYPNPFNPGTTISYQLPVNTHTTLTVYDVVGREVATLVNEVQPAGVHTAALDARHLASGVYFYRLNAGSFTATRKLLLMK